MNHPVGNLKWMDPVVLSTEELIDRYYRPEHLAPYCSQCENYGRNHACPPTGIDMLALLRSFDRVRLYAARLMMPPTLARSEVSAFFARGMVDFNREVMDREMEQPGSLAIAPGHCVVCERCARHDGLPCLHPEERRYALDAFLLETAQMSQELFGVEIQWYNDQAPPYLTMVGGLLLAGEGLPSSRRMAE